MELVTSGRAYAIPLPGGPCPPADNPEAILLWLYWRHLDAGRIRKGHEHEDPFWRCVDLQRRDRLRLATSLRADPRRSERLHHLAGLLTLDLAGVAPDERVEAVADAFVPLRFHLSVALAELGEHERAAQVLATSY